MMKVSDFFSKLGSTLKGTVKIALQSRPSGIASSACHTPLIIMANGPSLNDTMAEYLELLKTSDTLTVNFAPTTDVFFQIKPKYHILADPLFFAMEKPDNIKALYTALARVDWEMALLVPHKYASAVPIEVTGNPNIRIQDFNFVGIEGFSGFERFVYSRRMAMPRPRNVLVPALMCGIWLGYKDIYITGADHSWMQTISVDDNNNVISVQPHFYKDDKSEQQRVDTTYRNYRLHDIVHSFYVAFRSYHTLNRYAKKTGVRIFNSTPHSFIDAFPRKPLPKN